jgi:glutathione synthase/RimK-type ligase-like ATP-grasp enzyme
MPDTKRIALICDDPANMFEMSRQEDKDLIAYLSANGWDTAVKDWKDASVDWSAYDIVILKSPYDYHVRFAAFKTWLKKLSDMGVRLLNPYEMVVWNLDKHYLKEIGDAGFSIIPSIFLEQGSVTDLTALFEQLKSDKIIMKPCVSGGARNTFTLTNGEAGLDKHALLELIAAEAFIAQPFMPEIHDGEWSLFFFGGKFSHAILKKPQAGEFRVQPQYGSTIHAVVPEAALIEDAAALVQRFAADALYARVDGVLVSGKLALMELELIEPLLYLSFEEKGLENYAQALSEKAGI